MKENFFMSNASIWTVHDIPEILEMSQKQTSDNSNTMIKGRMELLKKYANDPSTFPHRLRGRSEY